MTDVRECLHGSSQIDIGIPDLDAGFCIQIQTLLRLALPALYMDFVRHIDIAAMRKRGMVSVVSFIEMGVTAVPLAVGGTLALTSEIRLCELSGAGPGHARARLGLEARFDVRSQPGTGDPRRYRETVAGAAPVTCGSGRLLLALVRPSAPPAERLVNTVPGEMAHLQLHALASPHPAPEDLGRVAEGLTLHDAAGAGTSAGIWGLHHSDVNQYVFTGAYISILEDMAARHVHAAGMPASKHRIHHVSALFKKPFAAGDAFQARGALYTGDGGTVLVAGIHALDAEGGAFQHPSVLGRLEGRVTAG
jgi:hypothetical protein